MNISEGLFRIAKGEVLSDSWNRKIYSVDASNYKVNPSAIACPLDDQDLEVVCQHAYSKGISVTARGSGTSLLGQSLSEGLIIDFTKHMNNIIEIEGDYVVVQPGLVKGILDIELRKRKKFFPPDPASSKYCTLGGMIANNSSGAHCLGYGNTIDFVEEVNVVYSDGKIGFAGKDRYDSKIDQLRKLILPFTDFIQTSYPRVTKNSCGYRLDAVTANRKFSPQKIFASSEGTLGLLTRAKLRIVDTPLYRCILVIGFKDLLCAILAVPLILKFFPVALEMLDGTVTSHDKNQLQPAIDSGCLLFAEFAGNKLGPVEHAMTSCAKKVAGRGAIIESAYDDPSITKIWGARNNALNQVMKLSLGSRKPVGLIEDTVVRPELLSDHVQYLLRMYRDNRLDYVMYGHVGDGNLHTRPMIDISSSSEVKLLENIAYRTFKSVIKKGGTITGEHGDGIARSRFIEMMYGKKMFELFRQVKKLFDPTFILNPGKKVLPRTLST